MDKSNLNLTISQRKTFVKFINGKIDEIPYSLEKKIVSEYAETNRVLPIGTPRPGPLDLSYTPYLVEPMNHMSLSSPVQHVVIEKAAQLGFTMAAECILCYFIGGHPSDQLFISATDNLLERWASKRLEPAIDSMGLRKYIGSNDLRKGSRRSGDKTFSKEYFGMRLDMASAQSAPSLRSTDKRILIRDEIDGAPRMLRTGEGDWTDVSYARTNAWGSRRKVFDLSTPKTLETSLIHPAFEEGDERHFHVPCPHCNKYFDLKFDQLKPEFKAGILIDVHYVCEYCKDPIYNYHKASFLKKGKWVPHSKSSSEYYVSYHLNSLYSPIGMASWQEIYSLFLKADVKPEGMRSFTNLYLGLPYKETGSRPKVENVIELQSSRKKGIVPEGMLYLTAAVDVQRGSINDSESPPRLEMHVIAHGHGYRRASIDYIKIPGSIEDPFDGAWEELNKYAEKTGLVYKSKRGLQYPINLILVDSGDGQYTDVVYAFTERWNNTYPCKGFQSLKKQKDEKGDELSLTNFKRYRYINVSSDTQLYEISTNYYKNLIYNTLKIKRKDVGEQSPGFFDFPREYKEDFFKQLTAEEKRKDGSFHLPKGRANEVLDTSVYAICAGDVYLDSYVNDIKAAYKKQGYDKDQLIAVNHRFVIEYMKNEIHKKNLAL